MFSKRKNFCHLLRVSAYICLILQCRNGFYCDHITLFLREYNDTQAYQHFRQQHFQGYAG